MSTSGQKSPLRDKVGIITGASSGIGIATAQMLARAGMKLLLVARSEEKLTAAAEGLNAAVTLPIDVTADGAAEKILSTAVETYGQVDALVNNAGMMVIGSVDDLDLDKAMSMVRLNVEAAFRLAILVARQMKCQGAGYILNVSSVAGLKTGPELSVYNGTKFAIEGFTDALRMELATEGIRVGSIEPGTVKTRLYDSWDKDQVDMINSGGALDADDIARSITFMLEQPDHMTIARLFAMPSRLGI